MTIMPVGINRSQVSTVLEDEDQSQVARRSVISSCCSRLLNRSPKVVPSPSSDSSKYKALPTRRRSSVILDIFDRPKAMIESSATVGPDTVVRRGSSVGSNTEIGEKVTIGPNVKIGVGVKIGYGTVIEEGSEIRENVEIGKYVTIGPGVIIGKHSCVENFVRIKENAWVGEFCVIMQSASLGANSRTGDNFVIKEGSWVLNNEINEDKPKKKIF